MPLDLIISGGQTGADQAALRAARDAGIRTGGWAPAGWLTEDGPAPWLAEYGLVECPEPGYPARRLRNVKDCHAALLFGDRTSPGAKGLVRDCEGQGKPLVWVEPGVSRPSHVLGFLRAAPYVRVVLVAGNRESRAPGVGARVEWFLGVVFGRVQRG